MSLSFLGVNLEMLIFHYYFCIPIVLLLLLDGGHLLHHVISRYEDRVEEGRLGEGLVL